MKKPLSKPILLTLSMFGLLILLNGIIGLVIGSTLFVGWGTSMINGFLAYPAGLGYICLGLAIIYACVVEKGKQLTSDKYYFIGFILGTVIVISLLLS